MASLFIYTHPPPFLLYLHLYFTPSLSCCLSVMWSRTDAGSPNCGTAISALLWLLGSLSETGIGDTPPSPSASKKKKEGGQCRGWPASYQPKFRWSLWISPFSEWAASHLQCSRKHCACGELEGLRLVPKIPSLTHMMVADAHCDAAHLLMFVMENAVCRFCVLAPRMKPTVCGQHSGLQADCPCVGCQ